MASNGCLRHTLTNSSGNSAEHSCGSCGKSFAEICILYSHLMKSCHGASFYYDHVTRTAYPRYDAVCSSTQTSDVDLVQDCDIQLPSAQDKHRLIGTCDAQVEELEYRRPSKVRNHKQGVKRIDSKVEMKHVKSDTVREMTVKMRGKLENRIDSKVKRQGKNKIAQQSNQKYSKYQLRSCSVHLEMIGNSHSSQQNDFSKYETRYDKRDDHLHETATHCKDEAHGGVHNADTSDTADDIVNQNCEPQADNRDFDYCIESKATEYNQPNKTYFTEDLDELEDSCDEMETFIPEVPLESPQTEPELTNRIMADGKNSSVRRKVATKGKLINVAISLNNDGSSPRSECKRTFKNVIVDPAAENVTVDTAAENLTVDTAAEKKSSRKKISCSLGVQLEKRTKDALIKDKIKVTSTWMPESLKTDTDLDFTTMTDKRARTIGENSEIDSVNKEIKMVENKAKLYTVCETCGKSVARRNIEGHLNSHSGIKPYICDACGKAFHSKKAMSLHKRSAHTVKDQRKKCPHCDKTFAVGLKSHMLVHAENKRFACHFCGKGFNYRKSLKEHERNIHGSAVLHQCPVCEKQFKWKNNWKTHMETHSKVHACSVCGVQFSHDSSMKRHLKTHTQEKPHTCHICGHGFVQKTPYWVHMDRHHDLTKEDLARMFPEKHGHVIPQTIIATPEQPHTPETLPVM